MVIDQSTYTRVVGDIWGQLREMGRQILVSDQIQRLLSEHGLSIREFSDIILGIETDCGPEGLDARERERHYATVKKSLQRNSAKLVRYKDILLDHLECIPGTKRSLDREMTRERQKSAPKQFRDIAQSIGSDIRDYVSEKYSEED
ncbi:hypothetical protein UF64_11060 [Thalassospira sp. HJ]|nr:hypothetical protein UF64_11060 [Thalassospira sp. HJ]